MDQPEVAELQREVDSLTTECNKLNKQRTKILAENDTIKEKMNERNQSMVSVLDDFLS
jgi:FtsZ-binding cell division protein ZapB